MNELSLLTAASGNTGKTYVDDVFSTYTYTGKGESNIIANGIDLTGKGGMVWIKQRQHARNHAVFDTVRGVNKMLVPNTTAAQNTPTFSDTLTNYSNNGFTLGTDISIQTVNEASVKYTSWTFRKNPKFFDIVTWTGNDASTRTINHSLGVTPGMIIVKHYSSSVDINTNWYVWHRSLNAGYGGLNANSPMYFVNEDIFPSLYQPNSSNFTVGIGLNLNAGNAVNYIAYVFAHDASTDGIIKCGVYSGDSTNTLKIDTGWEPQFVMIKSIMSYNNWIIYDTARGLVDNGTESLELVANSSSAESTIQNGRMGLYSTGFMPRSNTATNTTGETYVYMAIRRSNKPPTTGTQVYNAIIRDGNGSTAVVTGVGFAPDMAMIKRTTQNSQVFRDRLRGSNREIYPSANFTDQTVAGAGCSVVDFDSNGVSITGTAIETNASSNTYINYFFKRGVGVFDMLNYAGNNGSSITLSHNLGVPPELILIKNKVYTATWQVLSSLYYGNQTGLNTTDPFYTPYSGITIANSSQVTSTSITLSTVGATPASGNEQYATHLMYLFASKPGIQKIGTFTGNGTGLTVDCGFTTGARFVLVKRTDNPGGNWIVMDTTTGIVAGYENYFLLNSSESDLLYRNDLIDPHTSGFIINQVNGTNTDLNVSGGTYIYLAFA